MSKYHNLVDSVCSMRYVGPGLGIEINEQLVREYAERYSTEKPWINAVWTGEDGSLREW